jgi:integrase/recombinase XerC
VTGIVHRGEQSIQSIQAIDPKILLEAFLGGLSPNTVRVYQRGLLHFSEWLDLPHSGIDAAIQHVISLKQGEANLLAHRYRSDLIRLGLAPSTINGRLASLRSALKMARTFGLIGWSLDVPSVKGKTLKDTRGPGVHVVREMFKVASSQGGGMGLRDTAILRLLFDLALRRSEVASIDVQDLDFEASRVAVRRKGGDRVYLTLTPASAQAIEDWLAWLDPQLYGPDGQEIKNVPVFVNFDRSGKDRNRRRLTGSGLYAIVQKIAKKIDRKIHPHALRHSGVTQAVEAAQAKGYNLKDVLRYSGHKNVETLMVYVDSHRDVQGDLASAVSDTI